MDHAEPPEPARLMRDMFEAAVAAADPMLCIPHALKNCLTEPPRGRTLVIGAGKASARMAQALEAHWAEAFPDTPLSGLVVTRTGYGAPCRSIEIVEAAHPVPDAAGQQAATRLLKCVEGLSADDVVIALMSGGGSALLPAPLSPMTLADEQAVNRALLASGATITDMNCIRRHVSTIKGGRLAAACAPARLINLLISDVPGDNPIDIASGPTVGDPTSREDALAIIARLQLALPAAVHAVVSGPLAESVKPDDPCLARVETYIVAAPQKSLEAAAVVARSHGIPAHILSDAIEGEARDVAQVHAALARQIATRNQPFRAPCMLISGGETTVTFAKSPADAPVSGMGVGGRNVEFLLALAIALEGLPGVHALACDTDGVDGGAEIAGAWISPDSLKKARDAGLNARESLARHDGHGFFQTLGCSVVTGPTCTNVNDFRLVYISQNLAAVAVA